MLKKLLIFIFLFYSNINTKEKEDHEFLEYTLSYIESLASTNWDEEIKKTEINIKNESEKKIGTDEERENDIYKLIDKFKENKERDWNSIIQQKKEEIENAKNRGLLGHGFQSIKKASYNWINNTTITHKLDNIMVISFFSAFAAYILNINFDSIFSNFKKTNKVTFANIGGYSNVKNELKKIIKNDIKNTKKTKMTCIIFHGPPGTGKTFFAQAFANKANIHFKSINHSDILSPFHGQTEQNIQNLFNDAKKNAPCVIFFDEIDVLLGRRDKDIINNTVVSIKNLLLGILDGTEDYPGVVFIGATNRLDSIDPAFLRPGRFEYQIAINLPEYNDRLDIIKLFLKKFKFLLKEPLTNEYMAEKTNGLSPADLNKLFRILKELKINNSIDKEIFIEAYLQLIQGEKNEKIILSEKVLFQTALHESGHALITFILEKNNKNYHNFDFVTIAPRSKSLGQSHAINSSEYQSLTKDKALGLINIALAGRAAQEIAGEVDAGASNDLQVASDIAKKMILEYGLNNQISIEMSENEQKNKITNILNTEYEKVTKFLNTHKILLLNITQELLIKKTIFREDIINLVTEYEQKIKNTIQY
jgi:cell division protease FtsH